MTSTRADGTHCCTVSDGLAYPCTPSHMFWKKIPAMDLATTPQHWMPPNHQNGQTGIPQCGDTELKTCPPLKHMPDLLSPPLPTAKLERLTFNGMNTDNLLHSEKFQLLHSEKLQSWERLGGLATWPFSTVPQASCWTKPAPHFWHLELHGPETRNTFLDRKMHHACPVQIVGAMTSLRKCAKKRPNFKSIWFLWLNFVLPIPMGHWDPWVLFLSHRPMSFRLNWHNLRPGKQSYY